MVIVTLGCGRFPLESAHSTPIFMAAFLVRFSINLRISNQSKIIAEKIIGKIILTSPRAIEIFLKEYEF